MTPEQEKMKKVFDEINKDKPKKKPEGTTEKKEANTYAALAAQLTNLRDEHTNILKKIRSQPVDVVEKLLEYVEK